MKTIMILLVLMLVSVNAYAGSTDYIAFQLKRMADAEEQQSVISACSYLRKFLDRPYSVECAKYIGGIVDEQT